MVRYLWPDWTLLTATSIQLEISPMETRAMYAGPGALVWGEVWTCKICGGLAVESLARVSYNTNQFLENNT